MARAPAKPTGRFAWLRRFSWTAWGLFAATLVMLTAATFVPETPLVPTRWIAAGLFFCIAIALNVVVLRQGGLVCGLIAAMLTMLATALLVPQTRWIAAGLFVGIAIALNVVVYRQGGWGLLGPH